MTIVGKILVFLNLVFALIVGGMVMIVYMTRTNWEDAYKKKDAQLNAVVADRDQTSRDLENVKKDYDDKLKKAEEAAVAAAKDRDAARNELKTAEAALAAIKTDERKKSADVTAVQGTIDARSAQVADLEKSNKELHAAKIKLIEEKNEERKARIQADVEMKTYRARNLDLETQVRDMARELVRATSGGAGTVVSRKKGEENPPADNVEGRVTQVDPESNLVSLSIGSDAGLSQGHTLKVFRLHPIPEQSRYLGVIEILSVRPHEAVGRPIKPMSTSMRPGDRVASRLLVGN